MRECMTGSRQRHLEGESETVVQIGGKEERKTERERGKSMKRRKTRARCVAEKTFTPILDAVSGCQLYPRATFLLFLHAGAKPSMSFTTCVLAQTASMLTSQQRMWSLGKAICRSMLHRRIVKASTKGWYIRTRHFSCHSERRRTQHMAVSACLPAVCSGGGKLWETITQLHHMVNTSHHNLCTVPGTNFYHKGFWRMPDNF